jgi:hypothetical protein
MGYVKEPEGVDFTVDSTPLKIEERKRISAIISYFKMTGKKPSFKKLNASSPKKSKLKSIQS